MQRVDTSTVAQALPAQNPAGAPGYFTQGNPQTGVPATVPGQDWFNAVQEEIAYVITQAGIALNKADNTQLRQAIQKMIQSAAQAIVISNTVFAAGVANGHAVRWDAANNRFDKATADGTANDEAVGFADVANSKVYCYGETPALFAGLTAGVRYYLDPATPGAITTNAPTDVALVGIAMSATTLLADIDYKGTTASTASIVSLKYADYAIAQADNGKTLVANAALWFILPQISTLVLPFQVTVKLGAATGTSMTLTRGGTDTIIAGGASLTAIATNVKGCWMTLVADSTGVWQALYKWQFESGEYSIPVVTTISAAHGLGVQPAKKSAVIRCKTAEIGYSVGDEVDVTIPWSSTQTIYGDTWANAINVGMTVAPISFCVWDKSTTTLSNITAANWRTVLRAEL